MNDGMDMSVVHIDHRKSVLSFSSAQGHGLFVSKDRMVHLKSSKYSIGGLLSGGEKEFSVQRIEFVPGDRIYFYTDGVYDQFGGPQGKKLFHKTFRAKIKQTASMSMTEQQLELERWFEEWKGDLSQIDDVTIVGIEF